MSGRSLPRLRDLVISPAAAATDSALSEQLTPLGLSGLCAAVLPALSALSVHICLWDDDAGLTAAEAEADRLLLAPQWLEERVHVLRRSSVGSEPLGELIRGFAARLVLAAEMEEEEETEEEAGKEESAGSQ